MLVRVDRSRRDGQRVRQNITIGRSHHQPGELKTLARVHRAGLDLRRFLGLFLTIEVVDRFAGENAQGPRQDLL
jgi:hypothetical protein